MTLRYFFGGVVPTKTVYISYRPSRSLHIAQPLFNELHGRDFDVFMDLEDGVDSVNLRQIAAREHFIMVITPGTLSKIKNEDQDRLVLEFKTAAKLRRNIIVVTTRDVTLSAELDTLSADSVLHNLSRFPVVRTQIKRLPQAVTQLENEQLQQPAQGEIQPTPDDDRDAVAAKLSQAQEYVQQATIRLNTEKQFFEAVAFIREGQYETALRTLDLIIADNPNNENAYLQRAFVLRKLGRQTAALRDYEQAARLSPKLIKAHIGRGEVLLSMERHMLAKEAYTAALQIDDETPSAIAGMALTYHALDRTDEGLQLWGRLQRWDERYDDADWAGKRFEWNETLIAQLHDLTARLSD